MHKGKKEGKEEEEETRRGVVGWVVGMCYLSLFHSFSICCWDSVGVFLSLWMGVARDAARLVFFLFLSLSLSLPPVVCLFFHTRRGMWDEEVSYCLLACHLF